MAAMSDEEMDVPDMGAGGMDDMSSDGGDYGGPPADELPEGIKKEIITEAPTDNWRKPKKGDEVFVHYVGTLESDGSEFDSSRSRNKPFNFVLGQGQVIKGWDVGVATMKKGELAKFTLSPDFAYGESGSPPKIPASATLVFEVELLSWTSQDDLFNDGSVIKACITEGSGWKKPKTGDEVQVSFKAHPDAASTCDCSTRDYVVGTPIFGPFQDMVDKALQDMKKGEKCELKCISDYVAGLKERDEASVPEGTETVMLELHEIYEVTDVSFGKDKCLMKKQIKEGDGYEKPKEGNNITLQVTSAVDGTGKAIAGFTAKTLEFVLGNGDVCDALEFAVIEMKKQEQALLTCTKPKMCVDTKLGLQDPTGTVVLTLQLDEFEKGKDTWSMSEDEKIAHAEARKAAAATIFKAGRMELALKSYKGIVDLFNYIDNFKEENKAAANTLKRTCELNRAACLVKVGDWDGGRKACNTVLKDDSTNVKALFRRATCLKALGEFEEAMKDCKAILEQDKANADARKMIPQLKELQKKEDKKSQNMFANMCKGLGTFKTPPPQPIKKVVDDDDDDDDEEDMGDDDEPMPDNGKDDETAAEKAAEKAE